MKQVMRTIYSALISALVLLGFVVGGVPAQAATLSSIDVTPANPSIQMGQSQAFTATGTFSDGSTQLLGAQVKAVAAGWRYTCAMLSDGTVQCWGDNTYGQVGNGTTTQSNTPVSVSNITGATAITAGDHHACALLKDGTVQCWGDNTDGQLGNGTQSGSETCKVNSYVSVACSTDPVSVSTISGATAIAAGGGRTCALLSDGTVQCWGGGYGNTPVPVSGVTGVTAIAAGLGFTCALQADGSVHCWGYNNLGQLGNGATGGVSSSPVTVINLDVGVTAIAAGYDYACALLTDGTIKCWGDNQHGQLGNGSTPTSSPYGVPTPVAVSGLSGATVITAGYDHTCAVLSDGTMQCWGSNYWGQLGDGLRINSTTPVTVTGLRGATAITAGELHTCAVLSDGTVQCWGINSSGELGIGETSLSAVPVNVEHLGGSIAAISAGGQFTCALLNSGSVQCWGSNSYGQLGDGLTSLSKTPMSVTGIAGQVTAITAGSEHACVLLANGTVQCWGSNQFGQLGDGLTTGPEKCSDFYGSGFYPCSTSPVMVVGLSGPAIAISAEAFHTCALVSGGTVQCWGRNDSGELGDGSRNGSSIPVKVSGLSGVTTISVGGSADHTCAVLSDGTVHCWGSNTLGQLGVDPNTGVGSCVYSCSTTPVEVSLSVAATAVATYGDQTCALLTGGTVQCWGDNSQGGLGDGSTTSSFTPVSVVGITSATAITSTCALLSDGTVKCWGSNGSGQLGNGTSTGPETCNTYYPCSTTPVIVSGLSNATEIAAGAGHNCALLADGSMQCWGENLYGELGDGTSGTNPTPVSITGLMGVTWTSSDTTVATVDAAGTASALTVGTTMITATSGGVSSSTTLTVNPNTYSLSTVILGNGQGTVSGTGTYSAGSTATVTETAATGSTFTGWSGADASLCASGSITMNQDVICTATFTLNTYTLSLTTTGTGEGSVSGAGTYDYGTNASVSATPETGSKFDGWTGPDGTACTSGTVTMDANKSCVASFTLTDPSNLVVSAITVTPGLAAVGQTVTISATVTNTGTPGTSATADNFRIDLYKSLSSAPAVGQLGDAFCQVPSLAPGASYTCTGDVTYDTASSYSVYAQADTLNSVTETYETDNTNRTSVSIRLPDLRMISMSVSPTTVAVGDQVTVSALVENVGSVDEIQPFTVGLYKNLSSAPSSTQVPDASCDVSGLASSATYTCTGTVTYTGAGTFNVWSMVDPQNTVAETNEGNNIKGPVTVTASLPDLEITNVSLPTGGVATNSPVSVTVTIANIGGAPAGAFAVDLYQNLTAAPGATQTGDVQCTVSSLAAGATTTCSAPVTYTTPGTYSLWAQADVANAVTESNESNNTAGPVSVTVTTAVDLVIDNFTASPTYYAALGQDVTLSATIRNAGSDPVSGFEVDLYKGLSSAPVVGQTGDAACTITTVMNPGDTATCTKTVTYSATGYYNTYAQVDTLNAISETNETNNVAGPVRVVVRETDLRITGLTVSPSTVTPDGITTDDTVIITATVYNGGVVDASDFYVDLYKNQTTNPSLGQVGDVRCHVALLASYGTTTCSGTVKYSATGTYDVRAQVDTDNNVPETREGNNLKGPVYVTVTLPDLVSTNLRTIPTSAYVGEQVDLLAYVKNIGGYAAGTSFTVDIYKNLATAPIPGQKGDVTCTILSLAVNSTTTCDGYVTYDTAGTYQVWVQVDTGNTNTELDETNNITGPVSITVQ